MDPRFDEIQTTPENEIFKIVFFPDRIYHARYLNATRSSRYRYNVREVRSIVGVLAMKGEVFLDGALYTNFLRIEYRPDRLTELSREKGRFIERTLIGWARLGRDSKDDIDSNDGVAPEATFKMHYCPWIDAFQVEFWETLKPPAASRHAYQVSQMMGAQGSITRIPSFSPALKDLRSLRRIETAFRENDYQIPSGYRINDPEWDNNFMRSHQEPRTNVPSSEENTVNDGNYLLDFQRGFFLDASTVEPVRYVNAMMDATNPDRRDDNVIEMKWLLQRELGGSMVFFHEVTIPAGKVEGTHQHVGTEELYYITEGEGIAYMAEVDDPKLATFPTVDRDVFGLGARRCKEVPVRPGNIIFTKSGGIHGIRNGSNQPLKFVAFLYHTA
jgi:oxalate decarboxylase/phosphoglucose isomerase-like protein (cupin superfamily)